MYMYVVQAAGTHYHQSFGQVCLHRKAINNNNNH